MNCLTVMFSHLPYNEMIKHFNWTKDKVENLRCIWDISDLSPVEMTKNDNPHILTQKLANLRENIAKYFTWAISLFQQEDPDFFMFIEADTLIIEKNFDKKCTDYMKKKDVNLMFPWLKSQWNVKTHPFLDSLKSITPKFWTMGALTVISKEALNYYAQSMIHVPMYWDEIRFPSLMIAGSFHVAANPFIQEKHFYHIKSNKEDVAASSLQLPLIQEAFNEEDGAIHPIKDFSMFDTIQKMKKEK